MSSAKTKKEIIMGLFRNQIFIPVATLLFLILFNLIAVAAGGNSGREHFVSERLEMPEQRSEEMLTIDIAAGNDFPEDLTGYDLIIHCGACMATRSRVMARTRKALLSGVPITNYGIALAKLQGMLERVVIPGSRTRKQSS